ncbi:NADH:flavin oxidoreductase/NADH oxidase OS=Tsukamurella paurometabola (strain ATCC 8368 / DSM/ CCUG 35730 / CIP 100753 / JCM 10117 / KCTC 9821 / NBRC 16120/ NCIMB 702349 / NCTC 13040) OX=521096 GN=Tpau_0381 PE=4 SV=1 [Tsukamurella paurometabola]|uniref:NADH:flavin oxidoreductase/NADH oxidase n=1 Tax=Tsukamurella paurometabola (strain ATCC 8368 / DSM 20162 / CCUG 35730 / CIP 100753 / JCM 10117 / KCTC 9821 / NBRC 16120 / NCIMB 702349 / NCTC 13040) TaxID=521096 RepID=D5URH0_TSUPD|nr:FAD-dependent oxidoreductase [Tsukamurella paurometabola]ADG77023.1 NADH:flavin oxidoreductase/NADH oxidase [Tsukamurella paurometabola DSM 20162]SUP42492.1 Trimethylamine dehydrogenase [Tsukamurella paurometabola]
MRDPRYDILFEPVRIGPVTARNRFFQVPHCNGMGYRDPSGEAAMRRVKAEGGWAVVCTEQVEIHPTSDIGPFIELRLWDDHDLPAIARIAEQIHEGGALAGIELAHNGLNSPNLISRETPLAPQHLPVVSWNLDPVQARAMTKADIADMRRWHADSVRRSLQAGYDIVYVYAGHAIGGLHHFLSRRYNNRSDEYGGSLENRVRLIREILEDTREIVEGKAAVACRISVDELLGDEGITRAEMEDVFGLIGELPDLWDLVLGSWEDDSVTSRFGPEGEQEPFVTGLRDLTSKPVVGVGRFTSPDTMVRHVTSGILDLIGAARPSIADPFMPNKIERGDLDDIRECIGCNICVSGDFTMSPIRCTQNPTMGEEFRRGWHPESIAPKRSSSSVLVIGAGPAGLEAARALGNRGYPVTVTEASRILGGRVVGESKLPGLSAWIRVIDYRLHQIARLDNVELYRESAMNADDVLDVGFDHVVVATGASWRRDGVGRWHTRPIDIEPGVDVLTPDDIIAGARPQGHRVVLFDDDHYYLGAVIAELLASEGFVVTLVTPVPQVSQWTTNTMEAHRIRKRIIEAGVEVRTDTAVSTVMVDGVVTACRFTGRTGWIDADSVVLVTARLPHDDLYTALHDRASEWSDAGVQSVRGVGDAWAPGTIAAAVWSGHRFAEELDAPLGDAPVPFRREVTQLTIEPVFPRPASSS